MAGCGYDGTAWSVKARCVRAAPFSCLTSHAVPPSPPLLPVSLLRAFAHPYLACPTCSNLRDEIFPIFHDYTTKGPLLVYAVWIALYGATISLCIVKGAKLGKLAASEPQSILPLKAILMSGSEQDIKGLKCKTSRNDDQLVRRGRGPESGRRGTEPPVALVHPFLLIRPTTQCLPLNGRGLLLGDGAGMHDAVHCTSYPGCPAAHRQSTSLRIRRWYASHYIHVHHCRYFCNGSHVKHQRSPQHKHPRCWSSVMKRLYTPVCPAPLARDLSRKSISRRCCGTRVLCLSRNPSSSC